MVVQEGGTSGLVDGELVELGPLDALRVAPPVVRAFEAGPDGLELLVFGAHHDSDGEILEGDPWADAEPH